MFKNLEAELSRSGKNRREIAELLGLRYATVVDKMNGKYSFKLDEAMKIKEEFFPSLPLEYLFEIKDHRIGHTA